MGNHEFDNGVEGLIKPFLQSVKFPVVSANIVPDQSLAANISGYYEAYAILSVGSETVAVVGYTSAETSFLSMPGRKQRLPFFSRHGKATWRCLDCNDMDLLCPRLFSQCFTLSCTVARTA